MKITMCRDYTFKKINKHINRNKNKVEFGERSNVLPPRDPRKQFFLDHKVIQHSLLSVIDTHPLWVFFIYLKKFRNTWLFFGMLPHACCEWFRFLCLKYGFIDVKSFCNYFVVYFIALRRKLWILSIADQYHMYVICEYNADAH